MTRVDVHAHFLPESLQAEIEAGGRELLDKQRWTPAKHLAFMDEWGIETTLLSVVPIPPELPARGAQGFAESAAELNDTALALVRESNGRFGAYAMLPLLDVQVAAREAERALGELDLDGVVMFTNSEGRYLGDPWFAPLYDALDALDAVVFVHPVKPAVDPAPKAEFVPGRPFHPALMEFTFETARTVASLVYSGTLARYPRIRWIFAHAGGTVPFLADRWGSQHAVHGILNELLPGGPQRELGRLYYDTAQATGPVQLGALRAYVGVEHILFGTDWPPVGGLFAPDVAERAPFMADDLAHDGDPAPALDRTFSPDERARVDRANALALFPGIRDRTAAVRSSGRS